MALPTAYLTTARNLEGILNAIRGAQAPDKFTQKFLESLEPLSSKGRLAVVRPRASKTKIPWQVPIRSTPRLD